MLFLDLETYSPINIKHGLYKYAEKAEILLISYARESGPAAVVDIANGEAIPPELLAELKDPTVTLCAHNAQFDRTILEKFIPETADLKRWKDTRALAYSAGLPGSLKDLCACLKVPEDKAKDKNGKRLIGLFCVPQKNGGRPYSKKERPIDWAEFVEYSRLDSEALREIYTRLPKFNDTPAFWREWQLDQEINKKGMFIDLELARAAVEASNRVEAESNAKAAELSGGTIGTTGQTQKILDFARLSGYYLKDAQKGTLEKAVEDPECPAALRELLSARLSNSKASVKKYRVLLDSTNEDERLRGCLQFYGASRTGRWSGKIFQPQNLVRGNLPPNEIEAAIAAIKHGIASMFYKDENELAANCLRGAILAPKNKKLVVADLSNIEGRVLAWLAGEEWKLKAFRDFDAGNGPDLYCAAYSRTFGVSEVNKKQRQIGKVLELAMGYQGGVGAFLTFATLYGVDLNELAENVQKTMPAAILQKAEDSFEFFEKNKLLYGLEKNVFIALDAIKTAWRQAHPAIVSFWSACHEAAQNAIQNPKQRFPVGKVAFQMKGSALCIELPSGRFMPYPAARLTNERAAFVYFGQKRGSRQWGEIKTYAGKIVENITQAVARDILTKGMFEAESKNFPIILTVHDELITECPDEVRFNSRALSDCMTNPPEWAKDIPLAAAGWEGKRYRKD